MNDPQKVKGLRCTTQAGLDAADLTKLNLKNTVRYRESSKPAAPLISSDEILERVNKYPLSKNELIEYLTRLQNSTQSIAQKTYARLMTHKKFKEILEEVHNQRLMKQECKKIMDLCLSMQKDTSETLANVRH